MPNMTEQAQQWILVRVGDLIAEVAEALESAGCLPDDEMETA